MRRFRLLLAAAAFAATCGVASAQCEGGQCRVTSAARATVRATTEVTRTAVRTTTKAAKTPGRVVRRVFGR